MTIQLNGRFYSWEPLYLLIKIAQLLSWHGSVSVATFHSFGESCRIDYVNCTTAIRLICEHPDAYALSLITAMEPKYSQQVFGIQELYRPESEPTIDIVAVHGLNGDAVKSWTSDKLKICWLSHPDLLPKYLKCARVLTWGYNANTASLLGKKTSTDRVLQHAQTLIAHLQADREVRTDLFYRMQLFVCKYSYRAAGRRHAKTTNISLPLLRGYHSQKSTPSLQPCLLHRH